MPCYDGRELNSVRTQYASGVSPSDFKRVKDENEWLTGALCAVINELDRRNIVADILAESSRNGLIDVLGFWVKHKNDDIARLAETLHRYSKDEQQILKDLLNTSGPS